MMHGSTTEHIFFQLREILNIHDYRFMSEIDNIWGKRRILIVTSSCSFSLAFYSMDTN